MNFGNYSAGNPPLIDAAKPAVRTFRIDQHQQHNPDGHSLSSMVMQGADLSDKRDDAVKATQAKKVIEKDKEKTKVLWRKMMDKIDAQFLDELSSIKFAAKKIELDDEFNEP